MTKENERPKETIYTYEPKGKEVYFSSRNEGLARLLASQTFRSFGGEFDPGKAETPENAYWFLHGPISHEEADMLGMGADQRNFFGGVIDLLHAQKSVFHPPVPNAESVPDNFPHEFVDFVEQREAFLPGFTAFTKHDAHTAYDLLVRQGYVPRFKDPLMNASTGQYRLGSHEHLSAILETVNQQDLPRYGAVLEANMVGENGGDLDSLSGGWVEIDGRTNTSVGYMTFDPRNITPFSIAGSDRYVIRGEDPLPLLTLTDPRFHDEARMLETFKNANPLIPGSGIRATRRNYNFIQGCFEKQDGTCSEPTLRASEHTFRPGGATGAELLARDYLDQHPDADMVHTRCQIHYGDPREAAIPPHATIIHRGEYKGPGRYQDYIDVPSTVFAQIIEAS